MKLIVQLSELKTRPARTRPEFGYEAVQMTMPFELEDCLGLGGDAGDWIVKVPGEDQPRVMTDAAFKAEFALVMPSRGERTGYATAGAVPDPADGGDL